MHRHPTQTHCSCEPTSGQPMESAAATATTAACCSYRSQSFLVATVIVIGDALDLSSEHPSIAQQSSRLQPSSSTTVIRSFLTTLQTKHYWRTGRESEQLDIRLSARPGPVVNCWAGQTRTFYGCAAVRRKGFEIRRNV